MSLRTSPMASRPGLLVKGLVILGAIYRDMLRRN